MLAWNKKVKSFSLLELSIVLAIMGITVAMYIPSLTKIDISKKQEITCRNIEKVFTAIGLYLCDDNSLPGINSGKKPSRVSLSKNTKTPIPYKILGLNYEDTFDGFNHPMHYIANPSGIDISDEKDEKIYDSKVGIIVVIISEGTAYRKKLSKKEQSNLESSDKIYKLPYSEKKGSEFRQTVRCINRGMLHRYAGVAPFKMSRKK